jgi:hypothetical protein
MDLEKRTRIESFRMQLETLKSCLQLMQARERLLVENRLTAIEDIAPLESEMLARLRQVRVGPLDIHFEPGDEAWAEWTTLRRETEEVLRQMRSVNLTNAALVQNGLQFVEAMYRIVCPVQTYSPSLNVNTRPVESKFQARY